MENTLYKFPSIGQFYQFVSRFKNRVDKVTFSSTIKIHGTNSAIGYSEKNGMWFQSHKRIITPQSDNYKFAATMQENYESVKEMMLTIAEKYSIDLTTNSLIIYGEFCGGNIQKNVAITGLPVMFIIFDIAYVPNIPNIQNKIQNTEKQNLEIQNTEIQNSEIQKVEEVNWLTIQKFPIPNSIRKLVYNILDFPTYSLEIDFSNLAETKNTLIKLTEEVEKECPVGKYFGKIGTGEGIVWRTIINGEVHRFKVKGEEHSTSKVTTMAAVDVEKAKTLEDFVNKTVTENRLNQGINEIFGDEPKSETWFQRMGKFNQWVVQDIKKEDMAAFPFSNTIKENDLNRAITTKSSKWFRNYVKL